MISQFSIFANSEEQRITGSSAFESVSPVIQLPVRDLKINHKEEYRSEKIKVKQRRESVRIGERPSKIAEN